MSLRRRVLLGCAAVALVLFVADVALASTFRRYLLDRVDEQLAETAERIADFASGPPRGRPGRGGPGPERGPALTEFYVGIAGPDGRLLRRFDTPLRQHQGAPVLGPAAVRGAATGPGEPLHPFAAQGAHAGWRVVALQVTGADQIVVVGASLADVDPTYRRMVGVLVAATAAVLATLAAVAWWVLRQGVRPLAAMTATAGAIAAGALHERVAEVDERTEAGRLGRALNTMLGRIESAFADRAASQARLRRFVADASHELRTPLTSIRGYAELYRAGGLAAPEDLQGAMRRVEQEATRMGALVDDLLHLARLDQGSTPDARPVDLTAVVEDAARDLRAVEPARPVIVAADQVRVVGDDGALRQAVGNLLANARVHTPPAAPVRVTLRVQDGWAVVEVADEGPGMPAEVAARVFERFYRADPARARASGGAGLGLSIVAGIAAAHGGQITVDTAPGRGARFRLRLPLTAPATPAGDGASGLPDDSQRAPTKFPAASALPHRRVRDSGEPCPSET